MIPTTSQTVVLAPYEVRPLAVSGMVFSCALATAQFLISFDGQGYIPMQQGWTMDNRPNIFRSINLQNPTAVQITVTFYAGASAMFYSPPTTLALVTNAPTYLKGSGIVAIGAGASQTFNGVDAGKNRKQIIVTNLDAVNALYILDAANNIVLPVFAAESKTVELSGLCKVNNPNPAPVNAVVGEVFYA
jgi:hypothetical protein